MITFWIIALGLCALASAFIVLPLVLSKALSRGYSSRTASDQKLRDGINVSIYEERLSAYRLMLDQNEIDQEAFSQLEVELKRNLLSEAETGVDTLNLGAINSGATNTDSNVQDARRFRLPLAFAFLVPVVSLALYADLGFSWGSIADVALAEEIQASDPHDTNQMTQMVVKLAKRLEGQKINPADRPAAGYLDSWFLLAQSYLKLQQYEQAANAFKHLLEFYPRDPNISSYYAEAVYMADGRKLTQRAEAAIDETLALNPHDISMIEIKAVGLFQAGDLAEAVQWFRKALAAGAGEDRARFINAAIERIEQDLGLAPGQEMAIGSDNETTTTVAADSRSIQVLVEVADSVDAGASASVFIFARAMNGPPMPLAVHRTVRGDLPKLVVLDESMAMMAGMGLANFDQVQVVARISSSGIANVSPDDYEALSGTIDLTKTQSVIKLKLENRVKNK